MEIECQGTAEEIYKKLKEKFQALKAQGRFRQVDEILFEDSLKQASLKGTGFKSQVQCSDGKIIVNLDLNFLLKPMRGQIEESIRKKIQDVIG